MLAAYVVGEAKVTNIFAVYLQPSGFPSQSSEYAFECYRKQPERNGISLSYSSVDVDSLCWWSVIELVVLISFKSSMYTSSIACS